MIIRRHGYDRDIEVGTVTLIPYKNEILAIWESVEGDGAHNDIIESVFMEDRNIILFTSENW